MITKNLVVLAAQRNVEGGLHSTKVAPDTKRYFQKTLWVGTVVETATLEGNVPVDSVLAFTWQLQ